MRGTIAAFTAIACAAAAQPAFADTSPSAGPSSAPSNDAIVQVLAKDVIYGSTIGTGFFIDRAGAVLTTYSVGGETTDLRVRTGPVLLPARRLVADRRSGIAILRVDAETPSLPFADSALPSLDTPVVALGYPPGRDLSSLDGVITGIDAGNNIGFFATKHLRARVPALFEMGGAPLVESGGRVVGIVISKLEDRAGYHALPIRAAEKIWSDYLRFGEVRSGWMGVEVVNTQPVKTGVPATIDKLTSGGPGETAGLKPGDVLLQIGDVPIERPADVIDASFFISAGDTVSVQVQRGSQRLSFDIEPVPNPFRPAGAEAVVDAGGSSIAPSPEPQPDN